MKPDLKSSFSFKNRIYSFKYAIRGWLYFFRSEHNAWIQASIAIIACALGFYLNISSIEWCIILISIGVVLITEMLNTAIEKTIDLIHPEYYPKAGAIKDLSAGAVLLSSFIALIIGLIIFIPKIITLFKA